MKTKEKSNISIKKHGNTFFYGYRHDYRRVYDSIRTKILTKIQKRQEDRLNGKNLKRITIRYLAKKLNLPKDFLYDFLYGNDDIPLKNALRLLASLKKDISDYIPVKKSLKEDKFYKHFDLTSYKNVESLIKNITSTVLKKIENIENFYQTNAELCRTLNLDRRDLYTMKNKALSFENLVKMLVVFDLDISGLLKEKPKDWWDW